MKICTWNLGLFSWMKYAHFFKMRINGVPIKNEKFSTGNLPLILKTLKKINADILFLQEFYCEKDFLDLEEKLAYKNYFLINTWYHKHSIAILSNQKIDRIQTNSEFEIVKVNNINIIPVHFNSFSPRKRYEQTKQLANIVNRLDGEVIILGDTNFWIIKNIFLSRTDKKAYDLLVDNVRDASKGLTTTFLKFSMDKIFLPINSSEQAKRGYARGRYMDHYPVYLKL